MSCGKVHPLQRSVKPKNLLAFGNTSFQDSNRLVYVTELLKMFYGNFKFSGPFCGIQSAYLANRSARIAMKYNKVVDHPQ